jgi:chromosome segregation ATPase
VAALRQAFEGLNGGLSDAQQTSEAELRRQLEAATEANAQNEAARQQAEARCAELEHELNRTQSRDAATEPPTSGQKPTTRQEAWAGAPADELEQQVRQGVADLARVTAELAKERGERQRSQQRAADLNGRLQSLHEDYSRTLQAQKEDLARISSLEEQQHQASKALERSTADLEQQQDERRLAEEQLQKAQELNAQLQKDLSFFDEANKQVDGSRHDLQGRLETSLSAARESEARAQQANAERQRLTESLEESQRDLQNQSRRREGLEQELQAAQQALQERELKLKNETTERQRLSEELGSLQRNHQGGTERDLEFSKIQSALQVEQVERKRQETELARMRQSALEAAQAARTTRANLRRQVREPVDNLIRSAQSLLELEMADEQKKLAEVVLQDVLLVQTRLREPGLASDDAPESPATPTQSPA